MPLTPLAPFISVGANCGVKQPPSCQNIQLTTNSANFKQAAFQTRDYFRGQLTATAGDHRLTKQSLRTDLDVKCDKKRTLPLLLGQQELSGFVGPELYSSKHVPS